MAVCNLYIFDRFPTRVVLGKVCCKDVENRHHETRRGVVIQCKIFIILWVVSYIVNNPILINVTRLPRSFRARKDGYLCVPLGLAVIEWKYLRIWDGEESAMSL